MLTRIARSTRPSLFFNHAISTRRNAAAMPSKTLVHLHTLDLRTHDLPSLKIASKDQEVSHYLPVYIFDQRQIDLSRFPNSTSPSSSASKGEVAGEGEGEGEEEVANPNHRNRPRATRNAPRSRAHEFHRISPHRLLFLAQSVLGLRESYRRAGGDLIIGHGRPEVIVPKIIAALTQGGGEEVSGVYAQEEITVEEANMLDRLRDNLRSQNVELVLNDSKVAIPVHHLPFARAKVPDVYTNFRKKVEGLGVERGGMLVEPDQTTESAGPHGKDVKPTKLKPIPDLSLDKLELGEGQGGFLSRDVTLEEMYAKLVGPLLDSPPIGGWSSTVSGDKPPAFPNNSPIPFDGGEESALARLDDYVGHAPGKNGDGKWVNGSKARNYKATRNGMVGEAFSTKFSEFFSLGCLSAREVGWRVGELLEHVGRDKDTYNNVYWILFELLWRDFFQHTTYKYSLASKASLFLPDGYSAQIDMYPKDARPKPQDWHYPNWDDPQDPARLWCEGKTGVPFIDANMRELRETGWMSNRGRQNVASFLVKDLYVDWRVGAEWFEMHLVDYDTCSNWGNWQYQAGVGNDPRSSRQFNPIKQASDYDPEGEYVRLWIPELKDVPDKYLQTPWLLNDPSKLGGYPSKPIVELGQWKKHYPGEGGSRHRKGNGKGGGRGGGGGPGGPKGKK